MIQQRPDTRKNQIITTRLRIEHTSLIHKHLLQRTSQDICDNFNVPLTPTHFIIICEKYYQTRQKHDIQDNFKMH